MNMDLVFIKVMSNYSFVTQKAPYGAFWV